MTATTPVAARARSLPGLAALCACSGVALAQGPPGAQPDLIDLTIGDRYAVAAADARSASIVAAAQAFLATLSEAQREAASFEFADNTQRANWSNLPEGVVQRAGVRLGDLSIPQRSALDSLLAEVLSESGVRNVELQLAADDTLITDAVGRPDFGSDYYFVSFLGEPSNAAPWMLQFGGHHLAINVTLFGAEASFSPMLTGGQPLHVAFEGNEVLITERELDAAAEFMASLSQAQRGEAVRGERAINLLLGPGAYGTVIAPEGIHAGSLTPAQQQLLLNVVRARLGFVNDDDYRAVMTRIEAEIDQTYFAWWGPLNAPGAAYFRVTGPSIMMEYAPQQGFGGGDGTDHAHNMYRDPRNDYGSAWIRVGP